MSRMSTTENLLESSQPAALNALGNNIFHYSSRLKPGKMRLMYQPQEVQEPGGLMKFELHYVDLPTQSWNDGQFKSSVKYRALSYVWGNETNKLPILVDNGLMQVTRNLHLALTNLQPELNDQPIWVDAICINQTDEVEKHVQVGKMGDIYGGAMEVIAHLGDGDARFDRAMECLDGVGKMVYELDIRGQSVRNLNEMDLKAWPDFAGCPRRDDKIELRKALEAIGEQHAGSLFARPDFPSLDVASLLQLPWFKRAWVIQEISMSTREDVVKFACGGRRIPWEHFWAGTLFFVLWVLKEARPILFAHGFLRRLWYFIVFRFRVGTWAPRMNITRAATTLGIQKNQRMTGELAGSLKNILITLYVADTQLPPECRDRQDKVMAIQALASDAQFIRDLTMDETCSSDFLYRAVSRNLIESGNTDMLGLCRFRNRDSTMPRLPTWVTDWWSIQRPPWSGFNKMQGQENRNKVYIFDAGCRKPVQVHDVGHPSVLSLDGHQIDRISEMGSEWKADYWLPFNYKAASTLMREIEEFLNRSKRYCPKAKEEAKWRIPVGDKEHNSVGQQVRATELSHEGNHAMKRACAAWFPGIALGGSGSESYMNNMLSMFLSRPFVSEGGYVGLCPSTASVGDVVFIPCGARIPYIVKRLIPPSPDAPKNYVSLVGEAYVHGIMDGELKLHGVEHEGETLNLV